VPHLDYDAQRHGPHSEELKEAVATIDDMIGEFLEWLGTTDRWHETVVNLVNEYGFHPVDTPVFPNRALREAELLSVKNDGQSGEEIDPQRLKRSRWSTIR